MFQMSIGRYLKYLYLPRNETDHSIYQQSSPILPAKPWSKRDRQYIGFLKRSSSHARKYKCSPIHFSFVKNLVILGSTSGKPYQISTQKFNHMQMCRKYHCAPKNCGQMFLNVASVRNWYMPKEKNSLPSSAWQYVRQAK